MPVVVQEYAFGVISTAVNVTVDKPANTVEGNLLIAHVRATSATTWTVPSGWTSGANTTQSRTFYKIAGPSEPATYTFTASVAANQRIMIYRVTGHDPVSPVQATNEQYAASDGSPPSPTVTAVKDSLLICSLGILNAPGQAITAIPSGMTQVFNNTDNDDTALATQVVPSGATGSRVWTVSGIPGSAATSVIVNPAPADTSTVVLQAGATLNDAILSTSVTVNKPSGVLPGDLLLALMYYDGGGTITPPPGWTALALSGGASGFYRLAGGQEPASYIFSASISGNMLVQVARATGHHTVTPIVNSSAVFTSGSAQSVIPSVVAAANNGLLQMVIGANAGTWTPPSGTTESYDQISGNNRPFAGGYQAVGAGATGSRIWELSISSTLAGLGVAVSQYAALPVPTSPEIIRHHATNAGWQLSGTVTVDKPYGTAEGDLLIMACTSGNSAIFNTPSGWTALATATGSAGFWKIAGASEPATYTVTNSQGAGTGQVSIVRVTGHSTSNPIAASGAFAFANSGNVTLPSVTATQADTGLIQMVNIANNTDRTWTPPATATKKYDQTQGIGNAGGAIGGDEKVGSGATGTRVWTPSANTPMGGLIVAVNPAVAVSSQPGKFRLVYHTANTFTMPTGISGNKVKVQCLGPGGPGGAGNSTNRGGGGGGGALGEEPALVLTPGQVYDVIPGQADAPGGAAPVPSTFGPVASPLVRGAAGSPGGAASGISNGAAGAGGTVANSIGTTRTAGANGVAGGSGGAGAAPLGGAGGTSGANINGQDYGGGGGGGAILSGVGGTSGRGVVIVEFEYASDAVMASDTRQLVVNFKRSFNESVAAIDAIAKLVLKPRAETVTASDAITKKITLPKTDSVAASDAIVKAVKLLRNETVVTSDTITKILMLLKAEGVTASDVFTKTYKKNQSETVVAADTIAKLLRKPVADNVTVSDSVLVTLVAIRYFSDVATATDLISKRFTLGKADSVAVLESSFRFFMKNILQDSVVVSDQVMVAAIYKRAQSDFATATDQLSKYIRIKFEDNISGSAPPPVATGRKLFVINSD